jgi:hypothetical protein
MLSCRHEMFCCHLSRFAAYFPYAMSCFLDVMRCQFDIVCFLLHNYRTRCLAEVSCFLGHYELYTRYANFLFEGGEVHVEGCGRLGVHDVFFGRCVVLCVQVGWFVACASCGGGWCNCELHWETEGSLCVQVVVVVGAIARCIGGREGLCESCLMHDIESIRMFENDVTCPDHALVIQGGSLGGFGWWCDVCDLKNGCFLWAVTVLWSGCFLRPSFLAR